MQENTLEGNLKRNVLAQWLKTRMPSEVGRPK